MDDPGVSYRGSDGPVPNERQRVTSSRREGRERGEGEKGGRVSSHPLGSSRASDGDLARPSWT